MAEGCTRRGVVSFLKYPTRYWLLRKEWEWRAYMEMQTFLKSAPIAKTQLIVIPYFGR